MPLLVGTRWALLGCGGLILRASDMFTDADGTALTSHTPEVGVSWTRHTNGSNGAGDPVIDGNRVHNLNDASNRVYLLSAPSFVDGVVAADVVMRSDNNVSIAAIVGRAQTATTMYLALYTTNGNNWQLFKSVGAVFTQLGSNVGQTLTVDQAYRLELRMRGSTISLAVDNVERISAVDTAITAAGACGMRLSAAASATVGLHLDTFTARAA